MNWYKIAQAEKKPYKIYKVGDGQEKEIVSLKNIWAYTSEQARMFALRRMPSLRDFVDYCRRSNADCDVVARINMEEWNSVKAYQKALKERNEESMRSAWWNIY